MINAKVLENLNILANILQSYNTLLLEQDATNNDLKKALQEQNEVYFKDITNRLERIERLLSINLHDTH